MRKYIYMLALLLATLAGDAFAQVTVIAPWSGVGNTVPLSAATATARVKLGWVDTGATPPTTAIVCNTGSVTAYVTLGNSSVTATTNGFPVQAGACPALALNNAQYIAGITATSSTTLTVSSGTGSASSGSAPGGGLAGGMLITAGNAVQPDAAQNLRLPLVDIRNLGLVCNSSSDQSTLLQSALTQAQAFFPQVLYTPSNCLIKHASGLTSAKSVNLLGGGVNSDSAGAAPAGAMASGAVWQFTGAAVTTTLSSGTSAAATSLPVASSASFAVGDTVIIGPDANSHYFYTTVSTVPDATHITIPATLATFTAQIGTTNMVVTGLLTGTMPLSPGYVLSGTGVTAATTITAWGGSANPNGGDNAAGAGKTGVYTVSASQTVAANTTVTATTPAFLSGVTVTNLSGSPTQLTIKSATPNDTLFAGSIVGVGFDGLGNASRAIKASSIVGWTIDVAVRREAYFGIEIDDGNGTLSWANNMPSYRFNAAGNVFGFAAGGLYLNGCSSGQGVTVNEYGPIYASVFGGDAVRACNVDGTLFNYVDSGGHFLGTGSGTKTRHNRVLLSGAPFWFDANTQGNVVDYLPAQSLVSTDACGSMAYGDPTALTKNSWSGSIAAGHSTNETIVACGQPPANQAVLFANVVSSPIIGQCYWISDSTTKVLGETITGSGSYTVRGCYNGTAWVVMVGSTKSMLTYNSGQTAFAWAGATKYFSAGCTPQGSRFICPLPASYAGTARNMRVLTNTGPAGTDTLDVYLHDAQANSDILHCTITGNATSCADTTSIGTVATNSQLEIKVTGSGTAASSAMSVSVELDAP